ncbi:hypothetical protein N9Y92_00125 [Chlamydiales bacterium]|nr:hypothetical protein [Chlamydiales bacterium]
MKNWIQELNQGCLEFVSSRTGFIHWEMEDVIPIFENFCYTLSLMRTHNRESFLKGKEMLERLLPFQVEDGNFPQYLHNYPKCYHQWQSVDLLEVFSLIEGNFSHLLGSNLETQFSSAHEKLKAHAETTGKKGKTFPDFEMENKSWSNDLGLDLNPYLLRKQKEDQPKRTLYDCALYVINELPLTDITWTPEYLPLATFYPEKLISQSLPSEIHYLSGNTLFWGDRKHINSCALFADGDLVASQKDSYQITTEGDIEIFINRTACPQFSVEHKRVTAFSLDQELCIDMGKNSLKLTFSSLNQQGDYKGHISLGNRPSQLCKKGDVYDWVIHLRTLRKEGPDLVVLKLDWDCSSF